MARPHGAAAMRQWLAVGAVSGFLFVGMGAFGAHGLRDTVPEALLAAYRTGVDYHAWHTFAILVIALLMGRSDDDRTLGVLRLSAVMFLFGIVLFAGSLYAMALTGVRGLGAITPIGGVALLGGWIGLGWAAVRRAT